MSEVKLVVLYPTPTNVEEFDRAYAEEHVPLVNEKVPNLSRWTAAHAVSISTGGPPVLLVSEEEEQ